LARRVEEPAAFGRYDLHDEVPPLDVAELTQSVQEGSIGRSGREGGATR
jgi:hypothetical protein